MGRRLKSTYLPIPDDTNEETPINIGVFLFPKSPKWLAIIRGLMYSLKYGRVWDRDTGVITDAQEIGRQIGESFMVLSYDELIGEIRRLRGGINGEAVTVTEDGADVTYDYSEMGNVTAIAKSIPKQIPLPEFLEGLGIGNYEELAAFLEVLGLAMPDLDITISADQIISTLFDMYWKRGIKGSAASMALSQRVIAGAMLKDEASDVVNGLIDQVLSVMSIVDIVGDGWNAFLANVLQMVSLFSSDAETDPTKLAEIYNQVFVEGKAAVVNNYVNACCSGSGGESPDTPASDYDDNGTDVPDGYDGTYSEYRYQKCQAINGYIDDIQTDMAYLRTLDATAIIALGVGVMLVPGINMATLIGLLLIWVADLVLVTKIINIETFLSTNRDAIVCLLFDATNAQAAKEAFESYVASSSLDAAERTVLGIFITQAAINDAFEASNVRDLGYNCASCDSDDSVYVLVGVQEDEDTFTSVDADDTSYEKQRLDLVFAGDGEGGLVGEVTINNLTVDAGTVSYAGGTYRWRLMNSSGTIFYNSNSIPTWPQNCARLIILGSAALGSDYQPFTVSIDWSAV